MNPNHQPPVPRRLASGDFQQIAQYSFSCTRPLARRLALRACSACCACDGCCAAVFHRRRLQQRTDTPASLATTLRTMPVWPPPTTDHIRFMICSSTPGFSCKAAKRQHIQRTSGRRSTFSHAASGILMFWLKEFSSIGAKMFPGVRRWAYLRLA